MFATYSKPQLGWLRRSALCASLLSLVAGPLLGQPAFINEIHYDNISKDTGEAIEVAGPAGTDLFGWALALYNGRGTPNAEQVFGEDAAIVANTPSATRGTSPPLLRICELQGAGHTSPHKDEQVSTRGIVTAVARDGFYFQDPIGDGDERTSDGMFVFTKKAPRVSVGDEVQVTGTLIEYIPRRRGYQQSVHNRP